MGYLLPKEKILFEAEKDGCRIQAIREYQEKVTCGHITGSRTITWKKVITDIVTSELIVDRCYCRKSELMDSVTDPNTILV